MNMTNYCKSSEIYRLFSMTDVTERHMQNLNPDLRGDSVKKKTVYLHGTQLVVLSNDFFSICCLFL